MKIKFYDVEHGSCTHIITPNNQHFLVDFGSKTSKSMAHHIKEKYLPYANQQIDFLIITHPHEDHIYDLPAINYLAIAPRVLQRPREAYDIKPIMNTDLHKNIADIANNMHRNYNHEIDADKIPWLSSYNGGIEFDFIFPKGEWTNKDDLNTFSSIIIAKYKNQKFVLTGDNPKTVLQKMMDENYENIKDKVNNATMLLAPHHGRDGEFCKDFFDCVNPYLTVISDKNIEHGTQEKSASLYKGRGCKLYDVDRYVLTTRNEGTITFEVNDNSCIVSWDAKEY